METDIKVVNTKNGASLRFEMSDGCRVSAIERIAEEYWSEVPGTFLIRNGTDVAVPRESLICGEIYYVVPSPLRVR